MLIQNQLRYYISLIRLDKPLPILLLLWPTLWALWLAAKGYPGSKLLIIFTIGVIVTRSAGCVINDIVDRKFDSHVKRTAHRALARGKLSLLSARLLLIFLSLIAVFLLKFLNPLTIYLAFIGALLAMVYPFLKRYTNLPQVGLGLAFSWGIPMAFAAVTETLAPSVWLLFLTAILWPVIYDTMYALADREDDIKIGIKSTAILFGAYVIPIVALLQIIFITMLIAVGNVFNLNKIYFFTLVIVFFLFVYQLYLLSFNDSQKYIKAFLNNIWVGFFIFIGIVINYL